MNGWLVWFQICGLSTEQNNEVSSHILLTQALGGNCKCQLEPKHEMSNIRVITTIGIKPLFYILALKRNIKCHSFVYGFPPV